VRDCCSIYNVTFVLALVIPILAVGLGGRRTVYLVRDFAVMFVALSTLALLYVPKLMMLTGKAERGVTNQDGTTTNPRGGAAGRVVNNITVIKSEGSDRSNPTPGHTAGGGGVSSPVGRIASPSSAAGKMLVSGPAASASVAGDSNAHTFARPRQTSPPPIPPASSLFPSGAAALASDLDGDGDGDAHLHTHVMSGDSMYVAMPSMIPGSVAAEGRHADYDVSAPVSHYVVQPV